jgi:hypothetical protein
MKRMGSPCCIWYVKYANDKYSEQSKQLRGGYYKKQRKQLSWTIEGGGITVEIENSLPS